MQKVLQKANQNVKLFNLLKKQYTTLPNSRVKEFETIEELKDYLQVTRPYKHVVYAGASWNPTCEQAEQDFLDLSNKYLAYDFIKINSDVNVKAKNYFAVKCEPEFILMNLGAEMTRQTGQSKEALINNFEKVDNHFASLSFLEGTDKYENFEDQFMEEFEQHDVEFDWWAR